MSNLDANDIIIIVSSILATIFIIIMIKLCWSNNNYNYNNNNNNTTFSDISESLKNCNIINNERTRLI
jgi:hypothetical protein